MTPGLYWCWYDDGPGGAPVLACLTGYGHWQTWRTSTMLPEPRYVAAVEPPGRGG